MSGQPSLTVNRDGSGDDGVELPMALDNIELNEANQYEQFIKAVSSNLQQTQDQPKTKVRMHT
jgi:hypothetical protein